MRRTVSRRLPGLVLVSITPWGRSGPWAERPATDFTLQAESGSIGGRGVPGQEPFALGGRTGEFLAGSFAAAAAMAALRRVRRGGAGEWVDLSLLETLALGTTNFMAVLWQMLEMPASLHGPLMPTVETPSIEPTADGFVGFCTNSRQQFADFLLLIERPDLQSDEMLAQISGRLARFDEWQALVREWTRARHAPTRSSSAPPPCEFRWHRCSTATASAAIRRWWRAASTARRPAAASSIRARPIASPASTSPRRRPPRGSGSTGRVIPARPRAEPTRSNHGPSCRWPASACST